MRQVIDDDHHQQHAERGTDQELCEIGDVRKLRKDCQIPAPWSDPVGKGGERELGWRPEWREIKKDRRQARRDQDVFDIQIAMDQLGW